MNRKEKLSKIFLLFIGIMLITSLLTVVKTDAYITTTYYYNEDFNDEANHGLPASSTLEGAWYTFAKAGWPGSKNYADVNHTDRFPSHPFYINTSQAAATPVLSYANFTFNTTYAYSYLSFYFRYHNLFSKQMNHSGLKFILKGGTTNITSIYVYGANCSTAALRNRLVVRNHTNNLALNVSVMQNVEYLVSFTPDYDANTMNISIYNVSSGLTLGAVDVTLFGQTTLSKFYMRNVPSNAPVSMEVENLYMVQVVTTTTYSTYPSIEQTIVIVAVPVLLGAAIMMMILTGNITPEYLVGILVVFLIYIVTLSFLFS